MALGRNLVYYKLNLKNSDKHVLLDSDAYDYITNNEYLKSIKFLENLRIHSSGYAFFQKNYITRKGSYKNETIYLHKLVAEKFIEKPQTDYRLYVLFKKEGRLDCRFRNLEWANFSKVTRNTKRTYSKTGFRGVHKDRNKYRAVIYNNKKRINLGLFTTPEEAAEVYNKKSEELFGITRGLNKVNKIIPH